MKCFSQFKESLSLMPFIPFILSFSTLLNLSTSLIANSLNRHGILFSNAFSFFDERAYLRKYD